MNNMKRKQEETRREESTDIAETTKETAEEREKVWRRGRDIYWRVFTPMAYYLIQEGTSESFLKRFSVATFLKGERAV